LLKYKILTEDDLSIYKTVDEGIENRIKKYILDSNNLEELVMNVKTKRYTYNKIKRMFTHILCNFTKKESENFTDIEYIRVLGFSEIGKKYLNKIKKEIEIPIVSNYSKLNNKMLEIDYRATMVYNSIEKEPIKNDLIKSEYKNTPLYKR
ncbi:MAG TPA: nucleotidyltransferase family protein, partial [Tenericutes bacterium]|nr:nucleotidyltransferase family protein [Mycoplasmatota bacterium]